MYLNLRSQSQSARFLSQLKRCHPWTLGSYEISTFGEWAPGTHLDDCGERRATETLFLGGPQKLDYRNVTFAKARCPGYFYIMDTSRVKCGECGEKLNAVANQ